MDKDTELNCPECGKEFSSKRALSGHIRAVHKKGNETKAIRGLFPAQGETRKIEKTEPSLKWENEIVKDIKEWENKIASEMEFWEKTVAKEMREWERKSKQGG